MEFFVATPNRNYGRFIGDAIESVRMQGASRVKHHIQDALSSDSSISEIRRHMWKGLSYVSEQDSGQCDAVNRALENSDNCADVLSWLNSDEYYLPFAFDVVRKYFEKHPEVDIVYGNTIHTGETGSFSRLVAQHRFSPFVLRTYGTYIQSSSVFFRRRVRDAGDLYLDPAYKQVMDLELYLRLSRRGHKFGFINQPLSAFRLHDEQLTSQHGKAFADRERSSLPGVKVDKYSRAFGRLHHGLLKVVNGGVLREHIAEIRCGRAMDQSSSIETGEQK
ncbi:glycosyltransferase [Rhodococcus sp. USK10]|uniref:glycosyltransferase n=1 Tax=Rhodococcus sp. USK10 TaxID=2789739 RepID=UPI001C605128|nr:glycosyltransferase [Rhodococcus sp. USK10]